MACTISGCMIPRFLILSNPDIVPGLIRAAGGPRASWMCHRFAEAYEAWWADRLRSAANAGRKIQTKSCLLGSSPFVCESRELDGLERGRIMRHRPRLVLGWHTGSCFWNKGKLARPGTFPNPRPQPSHSPKAKNEITEASQPVALPSDNLFGGSPMPDRSYREWA